MSPMTTNLEKKWKYIGLQNTLTLILENKHFDHFGSKGKESLKLGVPPRKRPNWNVLEKLRSLFGIINFYVFFQNTAKT